MRPFEAVTELIASAGAQHGVSETGLTSVVNTASPMLTPVPAGFDEVSMNASAAFSGLSVPVVATTVDALNKWMRGAEVLVPVSVAYAHTDTGAGFEVTCKGSAFPV
ncbi:PE domain-containing protein [Nocardia sp. NPDC051463]|uniref:PE domain-containing protein n=1 Tax=Nocardia sp. NPDC051463 TaxID=3154845 RepID=UPI00341F3F7E